jgi:hypothetical protein
MQCWKFVVFTVFTFLPWNVVHAAPPDVNTFYRLTPKYSSTWGRGYQVCLDVSDTSPYNGAGLQVWQCNGSQPNQLWSFVPVGNGSYRIVSAHSAKCVDIRDAPPGAALNAGARAQQWECYLPSPVGNQTYWLTEVSAGNYRIQPTGTGMCLDVNKMYPPGTGHDGADGDSGSPVQQYGCVGTQENQIWNLTAVAGRTPRTSLEDFGWYGELVNDTSGRPADHANSAVFTPGRVYNGELERAYTNYGIKGRIAVGSIFFKNDGPQGQLNGLRTTYEMTRDWEALAAYLRPRAHMIASFYVVDEPYAFMTCTYDDPVCRRFTDDDVYNFINYAALTVKRDFPSSKTMIADARYSPVPYYPPSIDWIGFNCYGNFWNCNGASMYYWRDLAARSLRGEQKLVMIAYASVTRPNSNPTPPTQAEINARVADASDYVSLARRSDSKIAAIIPWVGPTYVEHDPTGNRYYGALDLPELRAKWAFLMRALGFGH